MASTRELIRELHDSRRRDIEEQRAIFIEMEGSLDDPGNAERQAKWDALDGVIVDKGKRIEVMTSMLEHESEQAKQREKYSELFRSEAEDFAEHKAVEDRIRTWMSASLPNAEVYAPKAITLTWETHDLVKGTTTAGGFTVPQDFVNELMTHLVEAAAVRQTNARVFQTAEGRDLPVPKTTAHGTAVLLTEGAALTEGDPAFGQVTLNAYKFGDLIQVSRELIQDTGVDLLGYLAEQAGEAIGNVTGTYFVTGTGTGQPQGIANAPTVGKTGVTGQTLTWIANDIVDLYHSIVTRYRRNATWIMNDLTAAITRKIRDDTGGAGLGNFLWQPGLQAGAPDTIFGRPVLTDPNMAVMAANANSVAFGDFSKYYAIRDVREIAFERSDDFAFANDLVSFRAIFRTDGKQIINGSAAAVKFYKNSAT